MGDSEMFDELTHWDDEEMFDGYSFSEVIWDREASDELFDDRSTAAVIWDEESLSEHVAYNVFEKMPLKDNVAAHEVIWDEEPQQFDGEMGESLECKQVMLMAPIMPNSEDEGALSELSSQVLQCTPDLVAAQGFRVARLMPKREVTPEDVVGCPEVVTETERVRRCVEACDVSVDAPGVVYVSKMFVVPYKMLPLKGLNEELLNHHGAGDSEKCFMAFAWVFSGVLRVGQKVFVLSPLYDPMKGNTVQRHVQEVELQYLYERLGQGLQPVASVGAGNEHILSDLENKLGTGIWSEIDLSHAKDASFFFKLELAVVHECVRESEKPTTSVLATNELQSKINPSIRMQWDPGISMATACQAVFRGADNVMTQERPKMVKPSHRVTAQLKPKQLYKASG